MGLGDSDDRGELHLIRLAKLTGLKGNPHISSKGGLRGLLSSAAGRGHLLLSLNSDVAQGKHLGLRVKTPVRTLSRLPAL